MEQGCVCAPCSVSFKERLMFKFLKKIRWKSVLITGALLILAVLSCFYFHYEFQAKTGLWYRKKMLIHIAPMAVAFGLSFFRPRISAKWHTLSRALFVALGIVLAADVFQRMAWDDPLVYWVSIQPQFIAVNLAITFVVFTVFWLLIWDSRIAVMVTFWFMWLLGYAYSCVLELRGTIFQLVDLTMLKTAFAVADKYRFPFIARYVFWAMFGVILAVLAQWIPRQKSRTRRARMGKTACVVIACACMVVFLCTPLLHNLGVISTSWYPDAVYYNARQGALTTLMKEAWEMGKNRPDGYDAKALLLIDERLNQAGLTEGTAQKPNVIAIMNESLTDFQSLYDIPASQDAMPFIRSLQDSAVYGNMYSSSYGGQTCNIEHSFLTGAIPIPNRLSYLLKSTNESTPSLAWQFKAQGYTTYAIHPEKGTNYQRSTYYPLLGLDTFLDAASFEDAHRVHGCVSDQACFDKIIELYEQKAEDERLFIFNVTMQNHGGYTYGGVDEVVKLSGKEDAKMEEYLNCANHTDRAFETMVRYFEKQEEPTVILMFGDHQPDMDLSAYQKKDGLSDMAKQFTQQITPFIIWANYPIEPAYVEGLSVNYLAALMLDAAGLPMTGYDQWLLDKAEEYPVVILQGYADAENQSSLWDNDPATWPHTLQQLNDLRYNRLYDEANRLPALRR